MPVSNLIDFLNEVQAILDTWTSAKLSALPEYPERSDLNQRAKSAWYRGQAESGWNLRPSVCRLDGYTVRREIDMNLAYRRRVSFLPNMPPPNDLGAWLSLMQHYRLPTRLLDWTESPIMALYFAIEEFALYVRWNRIELFSPVVWMVNPFALNWASTEHASSIVPSTDPREASGSKPTDLSLAFGCWNIFPAFGGQPEGTEAFKGPMAVVPHKLDWRMHTQRARFTVHGSNKDPIERMFRARDQEDLEALGFLTRINVEPTAATTLLAELSSVGITRSVLFPDPEGVAIETTSGF